MKCAVSFTKISAPYVAYFGNSLRMTYRYFSEITLKNRVRASLISIIKMFIVTVAANGGMNCYHL